MKKTVLKKTFPAQFLYPGNNSVFQFVEDYYTIFEGVLDGTKICFYNRNKSVLKSTKDGGKTYTENIEFENPSFFVAVGLEFVDIQEQIVTSDDGIITYL